MNTKAWIVTLASSVLLACSSTPNAGFDSAPTGDSSGGSSSGSTSDDGSTGSSGGSSGSASSSGAGSSGTGSSGGSSGASTSSSGGTSSSSSGASGSSGSSGGGTKGITYGTIPAADEASVVTLTATPFQVLPGQEVYKCQVFANPFGGVNTDILTMTGTMSKGSHHFFLFNISGLEAAVEPPVGTLGDCAGKGIEFHPFPFLSQTQEWTVSFPQDSNGVPMGYPVVGQNYLMINVHYLNTGTTSITANVSIAITPAKQGVVKTHVGNIFLNQTSMSVPANATVQQPYNSTLTWSGDPGTLPSSYQIFSSWSHMHQWALNFSAQTGGKTFYTETNWDSPNVYYHLPGQTEPSTATGASTPIQMNGNPSITWTCTYYNNTGATLTFGDSAQSNVMCIYIGQYYPANPSAPDDIAVFQ